MSVTSDSRIDRLYELLPAIYRIRDSAQGYPLQAFLRVIAEQVNLVEDDINRVYDNWFIETAEDWAVPYIADLIGYRPVTDPGEAGSATTQEGRQLYRALIPRREVANTIRYRRRKGTLALLELLANDVADWPARAVEFFKLLGWNQNINHRHLERAHTVDLRQMNALDLLDGPFDRLAHTVNVRRINSTRTLGRYNIPSVGVFIWRLKSYPASHSPAYCIEDAGPHCFTFSILGQDAPLFIKPQPETDPSHIAEELNLPAPIRRLDFAQQKPLYYGASLMIWTDGWAGNKAKDPVPSASIIAADLSDWTYLPPKNFIAVDPVLGRFAFPPSQLPKKGVRVSYQYGFSADIGGGEYNRLLFEPSPRPGSTGSSQLVSASHYRVGSGEQFQRIGDALQHWLTDKPNDAVIELTESAVFVEPIDITLAQGQTLQLRAANRVRPVIRLLDWQADMPDAMAIHLAPGSRFTLDGILVTGRAVQISGLATEGANTGENGLCPAQVLIRHSTLVPGWGLDCNCEPKRPAEPSLEVYNLRASVRIEHSILGSIQIQEDQVAVDPIPLLIADSLLDATAADKEAIGAPGEIVAHAELTILRSTVFGIVNTHAIVLAENSIFNDCVNVARRQLGCMRFCYVPPGCRTPKRYHCQPDTAVQVLNDAAFPETPDPALLNNEQLRLIPQYTDRRYGLPGYGQLGLHCADEICQGADDESEMGVFHDLFQPQRRVNLQTRLDEYTPAGMNAGLIFVT
ncbi:MAG: hypothetical protein PHI13_12010 [Methylococcales bacterium]|nr:hypothetical protein [Methylococcales bacterium]